jgi:3-deoxy-7-phosphoheptulonate synthase
METNLCEVQGNVGCSIPTNQNIKARLDATVVNVRGIEVGGSEIIMFAGPCAVESQEQLFETAIAVKSYGARILRGGAFKPRSSPHSFQGLGLEGLKLLSQVSKETGLPIVTEVMDTRQV